MMRGLREVKERIEGGGGRARKPLFLYITRVNGKVVGVDVEVSMGINLEVWGEEGG